MKNQLTPLKETGIYILELPIGATDIFIGKFDECPIVGFKTPTMPEDLACLFKKIDSIDYTILGTITSDSISFDPSPYLDKAKYEHPTDKWRDYEIGAAPAGFNYRCQTASASFRSLLTSCGYYWVNPMGDLTHHSKYNAIGRRLPGFKQQPYSEYKADWQSYQDNLVTNILFSLIKK